MIQATILKPANTCKLRRYLNVILLLPIFYIALKLIVIDWLAFSLLQ